MGKDELIISEINDIKKAIHIFKNDLINYSESIGNHRLTTNELSFFSFISKQIIFLKNIYASKYNYTIKVLISDYYNFIVCIIRNEQRYIFVNERSIIENYTRWIVSTDFEINHITTQVFEDFKVKTSISDSDYALIKSAYTESCGYIHGSKLLDSNLSYVFKECIANETKIKNINNYFDIIKRIIKIYNKLLIMTFPQLIDECFFRRKSVLKYLIGEELLELLFSLKNN